VGSVAGHRWLWAFVVEQLEMSNKSKTFPLGRDARTGQFIPVEQAKRRPATTTVERIPKAGHGDTKKK
jgi:hypothetical protein